MSILKWCRVIIVALLFAVTPAASMSQSDQAGRYLLNISLYDGERLVGQPRLTVLDGRSAIVTVDKAGGYSLRLVATNIAGTTGGRVRLSAEVFYREGEGWRQVAAPSMSFALGQAASVQSQQRGAGNRSFRMEVLARSAPAPSQ